MGRLYEERTCDFCHKRRAPAGQTWPRQCGHCRRRIDKLMREREMALTNDEREWRILGW